MKEKRKKRIKPAGCVKRVFYTEKEVAHALRRRKGKIYLTAHDLSVSCSTMQNYFHRWPKLRRVVREAKGKMLDYAEDKLYEAIKKGDAWAICFFLKTQGYKRGFIEHRRSEVTKNVNVRVGDSVDRLELPYGVHKALVEAVRRARKLKEVPLLEDRKEEKLSAAEFSTG